MMSCLSIESGSARLRIRAPWRLAGAGDHGWFADGVVGKRAMSAYYTRRQP